MTCNYIGSITTRMNSAYIGLILQKLVPVISSPSSSNSSSSTVPVNNKVPSTPTKLFQGYVMHVFNVLNVVFEYSFEEYRNQEACKNNKVFLTDFSFKISS